MSFISYKTIIFIVLGGKKVKMNGMIGLCLIIILIIGTIIAVELSITLKKIKEKEDKVSKHK